MRLVLALAGDTMLGRAVGVALEENPAAPVFAPEVAEIVREADLFVLNLECCISSRGERWPAPGKPFFFRAPPVAAEVLARLGVSCATLANNHILDFGRQALLDTLDHLSAAGIAWTGAGPDPERARAPVTLEVRGARLAVVAAADHPADYAVGPGEPGIAFADLRAGVPGWLRESLASARATADMVLFAPHWGRNFSPRPEAHVRAAAAALRREATFVAGHSAHVFHGVEGNVLYDVGDFVDDYSIGGGTADLARRAGARAPREIPGAASDVSSGLQGSRAPGGEGVLRRLRRRVGRMRRIVRAIRLRPELGLLFLVTLEPGGPVRLEGIPLELLRCHTRLARGADAEWARARFRRACRALGTEVCVERGRVVIAW
jgi:poly-gamma-glutamate synthesis protein (capsule biosynthesis protein)